LFDKIGRQTTGGKMKKTIKLPSGATVTLKDPSTLRVKDRKRVMTTADQAIGGDLSKALALGDALLAMLIEEWSFELLVPSLNLDSLGELEMKDYDYLVEQTKDAQSSLFPNLADTPTNEADPKAPTANSNA
jgi:hypothetical protein